MDNYTQILKRRLTLCVLYNSCILILLALGVFHMTTGNEHVSEFISGFNVGVCVSIQIIGLYMIGKYYKALKDQDKLKKLYIEENDERAKFIKAKIGGAGLNIVIGALALGTVLSGFFNETVFFTLWGALFFSAMTKMVLKRIYIKKY